MEPALRHSAWHRVFESLQRPYKATLSVSLHSLYSDIYTKYPSISNNRQTTTDKYCLLLSSCTRINKPCTKSEPQNFKDKIVEQSKNIYNTSPTVGKIAVCQ